MTFIIVLVAFIMERFFHWQHLRQWKWFYNYELWLSEHSLRIGDFFRLLLSIAPPVIIVGVIQYIIIDWVYGILELLFSILVLLYCLGPRNLWLETNRCINELDKEDPKHAIGQAKLSFGVFASQNSNVFHKSLIRAIFVAAHDRIFAVICWFVVLGPVGAVLYRLMNVFSTRSELGLTDCAFKVKQIMDWVPVRIFTFIFALGGHFTEVITRWEQDVKLGLSYNETMLADCGEAALDRLDETKTPKNSFAENEVIALIDRSFVIFLVVLAFIVIVI